MLYLLTSKPSRKEIEDKILSADIVYVGGGNTLKMMTAWRKYGVDKALEEAYKRNIVLSGVSAGAICWFRYGSSDSRKFANPEAGLIKLRGLNFINTLCCPHYDAEADRRPRGWQLLLIIAVLSKSWMINTGSLVPQAAQMPIRYTIRVDNFTKRELTNKGSSLQ